MSFVARQPTTYSYNRVMHGKGSGEYIHAVVNKINFCSPGDMHTKMDQQQQSGKSMAYI